jgi:hypothetical protein
MALLAVQNATAGLQDVVFSAATGGGDTAPAGTRAAGWDLGVFLVVNNRDAASKTVTVDGTAYVVPLTTGVAIIPLYAGTYGTVKAITYSAVTSLFVAAVRVAPAP